MKLSTTFFLVAALAGSITGCGPKLADPSAEQGAFAGEKSRSDAGEQVDIEVGLVDKTHLAYGLVQQLASAYTMVVDSCASGFTTALNETNSGLKMLKSDLDCLAKLQSVTVGGVEYLASAPGSQPFTTWQAGDTATFFDASGSLSLLLIIDGTIAKDPPGIAAGQSILISFIEILGNGSTDITDKVTETNTISISGSDAPAFELADVDLTNLNNAGAGFFAIDGECSTQLDYDANAPLNSSCDGVTLADLEMILTADPGGVLDLATLAAFFDGSEVTLVAGEVVQNNANTLPNGGFSKVFQGPDNAALNPDLILIVRANGSYTYWRLTFDLTQP